MATRRSTADIFNCLPSPTPEKNWTIETAVAAGLQSAKPLSAKADAALNIDLRAAWWQVGDQGNTGSCVGWGSADGVLRWHFVKAGKLANRGYVGGGWRTALP